MAGPAWSAPFEEFVEEFVERRGLPGVSVGVAEKGREVYVRGFGLADREEKRAITPDTIYGIGSITKSFTSLAVMQLAEAGRLDLDAPVTAHAPELARVFGDRAAATTLRHFMSHSTGMPPLPVLMAALRTSMEADPDAKDDLKEVDDAVRMDSVDDHAAHIELLRRLPFPWLGAPGEHFSYSNDCYGLLGLIIERASGVSYERYVEEHILRPAGLTRTLFDHGALAAMGDVATSYTRRRPAKDQAEAAKASDGPPEVVRSPAWWWASAQTAAGFLKSSARDLLRYIELYQGSGRAGGAALLSPAGVGRMTAPAMAITPTTAYGYGLALERYAGLDIVQHSGGLKAISAFVLTVPEERLSVSVLINLGGEGAGRVGMAVVNALLGRDPAALAPVPAEVALPAERSLYTGRYYSGESMDDLEIQAAGGGLVMVSDGKRQRMQPVGDGYFVAGEGAERSWLRPLVRDGRVFALQAGSRIWARHELWDAAGYPTLRPAAQASR